MTHSHLHMLALTPQSIRARGFTLIELMITVVVATILISIAIPLYQHQVREARRTDARSTLSDLASREERYYAIKNVYSTAASDLGYPNSWPETIGGGFYQIAAPTVVAATATAPASFSITATPIAGKGQDKDTDCASFTVVSTGQNTSLNSGGSDSTPICWK